MRGENVRETDAGAGRQRPSGLGEELQKFMATPTTFAPACSSWAHARGHALAAYVALANDQHRCIRLRCDHGRIDDNWRSTGGVSTTT